MRGPNFHVEGLNIEVGATTAEETVLGGTIRREPTTTGVTLKRLSTAQMP